MKKLRRSIPLLIASLVLLQSCGYKQNHVLFQSEKKLLKHGLTLIHVPKDCDPNAEHNPYCHIIHPGDRIAVKFLNNYDISTAISIVSGSNEEISFLVDINGEVVLPLVGRVFLKGMTSRQASEKLESLYSANFKDPKIEIQLIGLRVSMLGEVTNPGIYPIDDAEVPITDIIAKAGGITQNGKATSVRLLRKNPDNDSTLMYVFDFTNVDVIQEKEIIVHDKDIIVVEPTNIRVLTLAIQPYFTILSIVSTVTTMALLVIQLSRKTP